MQPANWTNFLYTSRLASALGLWPFTDTLLSTETSNLLLATLSAGPVGIGDPVGTISAANLSRAVRGDGVIVKPDAPIVPADSSYLAAATAPDLTQMTTPQIAATYTDFGGLRAYYLLAYLQGVDNGVPARFRTADFGMGGPAFLYNYFKGQGQVVNPSDQLSMTVGDALYLIAAPIGRSGIAVLGDLGQFVTLGKKRVPALTDDGTVHMTVAFAAGEGPRSITGYAPVAPLLHTSDGMAGPLNYDTSTGLFHFSVSPSAAGTASVRLQTPQAHSPFVAAPTHTGAQ
ncbi:MAG: hypothetical protein JO099_15900 [Acidobacteriia bacterium]|nr:hypothetical protein [Terriglobia bacterium]